MTDQTPIQCADGAVDLDDSERTPCEVWTRVMGYHRPIALFNPGKRSEHAERRYFREPTPCHPDSTIPCAVAA